MTGHKVLQAIGRACVVLLLAGPFAVWPGGVVLADDEAGSNTRVVKSPLGDVTIIEENGRRDLVINGQKYTETVRPAEPAITPSVEEEKLGYVVYSRAASDGVLPRSRPRREEVTSKLSTFVTQGETRHVQFTVFALKDLGDVSVKASDLVSDSGSRLPASCLVIRPVRFRYLASQSDPNYIEYPKILDRPGVPTRVDKDTNQTFWTTIRTPKDAKPGKYIGTFTISPDEGKASNVQITIEVLPFKLGQGKYWGMLYYDNVPLNKSLYTDRDFADMKAHGVNSILYCPTNSALPPFTVEDGKIKVDFKDTDKDFAIIKKHGFREPITYYPRNTSTRLLDIAYRSYGLKSYSDGGAPDFDYQANDYPEDLKAMLGDIYSQMVEHAKKAGWPQIYWYWVDEPNDPNVRTYQQAILEYSLFKKAAPQEKTICMAYKPEVQKVLDPWVDVRVADLWQVMGNNDMVDNAHKSGDTIYAIRWIPLNDTYSYGRYVSGLLLDKVGVDGMAEWEYAGPSNRTADPYGDMRFGVNSKDPRLVYFSPVDGSYLPTITWEAIQEGIDDGRYVSTLKELITTAGKSNDPNVRSASTSAQAALERILGPRPQNASEVNWGTEERLNLMRRAIADEILRLRNVMSLRGPEERQK